ncbi:hypothetical protein QBC38DRAFT_83812 [Podospora fimiseda]|uniref:Uncharacterized protein n=1 Tax=Podospora fimiseda TaxID=252190 RepID=A0AAN7BVE3_9PEZI|nr:hypothetical protein QBC38DRAFT_83812 [Podospora fimiseda]
MATLQYADEDHRTHPVEKFNKFYRFFDLPRELRDQILEEICLFPNGVVVHYQDLVVSPADVPAEILVRQYMSHEEEKNSQEDEEGDLAIVEAGPPLDLFLCGCEEIHQSAMEIYYGRNTFHLDLRRLVKVGSRTHSLGRRLSQSQRFLMSPGKGRIMIRSLDIYCRRFSAIGLVIPSLKEMVLGASLRKLQFRILEVARKRSRVWEQFRTASMWTRTELTSTPVFKELVELLADPDLKSPRLKVGKDAHHWAWCPYHEEGKTEKQEYSVRPAGVEERIISACAPSYTTDGRLSSNDWLDIDLSKLLKACGGDAAEFKVVKVDADQGTY